MILKDIIPSTNLCGDTVFPFCEIQLVRVSACLEGAADRRLPLRTSVGCDIIFIYFNSLLIFTNINETITLNSQSYINQILRGLELETSFQLK